MAGDISAENRPIVTRKQAKAIGAKRYFTGNRCPAGHTVERMVSTGRCVICLHIERDAWKVANPERTKAARAAYYAANRERENEQTRIWQSNNRELMRATKAKYRTLNKEKVRAWFVAWQRANLAKYREYNAKRRALQSGESHTAAHIIALLKRQRGKCAHPCCRKNLSKGYHVDHIIPLALGGSNGRRNIQLLCPRCNQTKHATHPIDFAQRHGMLL